MLKNRFFEKNIQNLCTLKKSMSLNSLSRYFALSLPMNTLLKTHFISQLNLQSKVLDVGLLFANIAFNKA